MKTQDYDCQGCGETVTRPLARGQRPKWCADCRARSARQRHCSACGAVFVASGGKLYCSRLCALYAQHGARSCAVPALHPSRRRLSVVVPKPREWATQERECPRCGVMFVQPHTPNVTYCSKRCAKKASKIRRRVREAGTYGEWTWSDFMRIARRFRYCCAYCGEKPERLDPDHVVPLSRGGPNVLTNLLPSCPACNTDKSAHLLNEWAESRVRRGLPPRATSWAPEDPRYHHLTWLRAA